MELELKTFLTTLCVITDNLYATSVLPKLPATGGPALKLSDSKVLCLGLAAHWRSGVPWKTERGFARYALKYLRAYFSQMTSQSAFHRRLRRLWGAFILIQQGVADQLWCADDCEIMDCVPVPIARGARAFHPGWLADIARIGKGGNDRCFYGLHLLLVVSASGVATSWTLAAGPHSGPLAGRVVTQQPGRAVATDGATDRRRDATAEVAHQLDRTGAELRSLA